MTKTAIRFLAAIRQSWDSLDPWQQTVYLGLSEYDQDALLDMCEEGEDVGEVFAEVLQAIEEHVKASGGKVPDRDIWTNINQEELRPMTSGQREFHEAANKAWVRRQQEGN